MPRYIELRLARFLVLQLRRTPGADAKDKVAIDLGMSQGELALRPVPQRRRFRTRDQRRIDPLTVTDNHSRFLIELRIVAPTTEGRPPRQVA